MLFFLLFYFWNFTSLETLNFSLENNWKFPFRKPDILFTRASSTKLLYFSTLCNTWSETKKKVFPEKFRNKIFLRVVCCRQIWDNKKLKKIPPATPYLPVALRPVWHSACYQNPIVRHKPDSECCWTLCCWHIGYLQNQTMQPEAPICYCFLRTKLDFF